MNPRQAFVYTALGASILLLGLLLLPSGVHWNSPNPLPAANAAPTDQSIQIRYGPGNLIGKSSEEVGQLAQQTVKSEGYVHAETPQVLLVRSVERETLPTLGLDCIPEFMSIEQPPLILVILRGDFDLSTMPGAVASSVKADWKPHYIAYVFDVWSGFPVHMESSYNGGRFRTVLNDPSLPEEAIGAVAQCPPPSYKKTLHYGDTVPAPTPGPLHPDGSK